MRRIKVICAGILTAFILCGGETALSVVPGHDFLRYQIILDKKPFGEITPSEASQPQAPLGDVFSKEFEMKAIVDDGTGVRVGLLDKKTNKSFFLGVGESGEGLQLVSVDYDKEEAVVKKDGETAVVKLRPDKDKGKDMAAALPAAVPAGMNELPFQPPVPSASAARRPFFSDLKRRRASPFQPAGTNLLPFQAKSAESFFKVSTGAFPQAQSPFSAFQVPQGGAAPGVFQQITPGVSNAPSPFAPINPQNPNAQVNGKGATIDQLLQRQSGGEGQPVQPAVIQTPAEGEISAEEIAQ